MSAFQGRLASNKGGGWKGLSFACSVLLSQTHQPGNLLHLPGQVGLVAGRESPPRRCLRSRGDAFPPRDVKDNIPEAVDFSGTSSYGWIVSPRNAFRQNQF